MLKYFVLLAIAVAIADSLYVCPPRVCERVKCENLDHCMERNGFKIREKGGFCQCCDLCVRVLGLGEICGPQELGVVINYECASGLLCDRDMNVCVESSKYKPFVNKLV